MQKKQVDVAIIGAGTAGMGAYREARKHTDRIALIEGGQYGTTCARVGCMPSKLLIAAANAAHAAAHSDLFGIHVPQVKIDGKAVLQRVKQERDRFVGFVIDDVSQFDHAHKVRGYARFLDSTHLRVGETLEIEAERTVIATGSRPYVPDLLRNAGDRLLVNDDLFELDDLPQSIVVVGAGVIGLELGQALSRLNVQVTLLARSHSIGGLSDATIRAIANNTLGSEFDLRTNAQIVQVSRVENGVVVGYRNEQGKTETLRADYILSAAGRQPNLEQLALEKTGMLRSPHGVPVFDARTGQTSLPNIFLAGDATNELTLLHEASDEGRIAGSNAGAYPIVIPGERRTPLSVVFCEPQIATIGQRAADLPQHSFVTGVVSFHNQGRSRVMAKNSGMLKIYAERRNGRLLGAEMFGPAAEHIGHLLSWAVQQRMTVYQALTMPFYHPVIEEGVRTALRDAAALLRLATEKDRQNASIPAA